MSKIKKLLIVSCSTGSGHFRAAEALRLSCQKMYPEVRVLHIDLADYLSGFARAFSVSSYNLLITRIPKIYKFIYHITDRPFAQKVLIAFRPFFKFGAGAFFKKIKDYQPDFIISTQFTPQLLLPKNFSTPLDTVITDYHAHQIWLAPCVRNFFVASEDTKIELSRLFFGEKSRILDSDESESGEKLSALSGKIIVSGLPLHSGFFDVKNTAELKKKLNINNDWPIILIMPIASGKISAKDAVSTIFSYHKNINVVAISGKDNRHTFNDLENIKESGQKNFTILKTADNIDEWMRIADVIVGKAGGLSVSEAMHLQKPIIIINPIPGQEDFNAEYLEKNHYGLKANSSDDLAKKIQTILENPRVLKTESHPDASEIILRNVFS